MRTPPREAENHRGAGLTGLARLMATLEYLIPITDTVSGTSLMTARVAVPVNPQRNRELLEAGRLANGCSSASACPSPARPSTSAAQIRFS